LNRRVANSHHVSDSFSGDRGNPASCHQVANDRELQIERVSNALGIRVPATAAGSEIDASERWHPPGSAGIPACLTVE